MQDRLHSCYWIPVRVTNFNHISYVHTLLQVKMYVYMTTTCLRALHVHRDVQYMSEKRETLEPHLSPWTNVHQCSGGRKYDKHHQAMDTHN